MSNDYSMMEVIRKVSKEAERHQCDSRCQPYGRRAVYAKGTPPPRYLNKFARFAQKLGITMKKSWTPREYFGPGCDGFTSLWVPPFSGEEANVIKLVKDMPPAHEFVVSAHELTHAFLGHPPKNEQEAEYLSMVAHRQRNTEFFSHEVPAHLAAIAAADSAGLQVAPASVCYLHDRIRNHRRYIGESEQYPAFQAARVISGALA